MRISEPYTIFPRTLKSGKTVYYYQFRKDDGSRSVARSTGCTTEASAKRFCKNLYNSGAFQVYSELSFSVYTKDFFSHSSEYYKWKIVNNSHITDETLMSYDKFLRNQLLPYFGDMSLKSINRSKVKNWIIWASDRWSPKTINNAQTTMNIIMNQAVEQSLIEFNPLLNLSFRKTEKKNRILLTVQEVKQIYKCGLWKNELFRKAFLLDCITGMRISEIVALTNSDIKENYIDVTKSFSRKFGTGETKTHTCRQVPIPSELELFSDSNFIFQDENNSDRPISICRIYNALLLCCRKLGIDTKQRGITTHTLRNFFISYMQSKNISEAKIRAVVGHKDSTMTGLYTYWKADMFPEVYKAQKELFDFITN